jgi:putative transposase
VHPTAAWIVQQMRDAFPFDGAPKYLIFDRDTKFGEKVQTAIKNMGTGAVITGYRAPWQMASRRVGSDRCDDSSIAAIYR